MEIGLDHHLERASAISDVTTARRFVHALLPTMIGSTLAGGRLRDRGTSLRSFLREGASPLEMNRSPCQGPECRSLASAVGGTA
jgi:hypothetical protein